MTEFEQKENFNDSKIAFSFDLRGKRVSFARLKLKKKIAIIFKRRDVIYTQHNIKTWTPVNLSTILISLRLGFSQGPSVNARYLSQQARWISFAWFAGTGRIVPISIFACVFRLDTSTNRWMRITTLSACLKLKWVNIGRTTRWIGQSYHFHGPI